MNDPIAGLPIRQGHFVLESGLHTDLWITLDTLFLEPRRIAPSIELLAQRLHSFEVTAVCGPFVGGALLAQAVAVHLGVRFYYAELTKPSSGTELFDARYRMPLGLKRTARYERFAAVDEVISAGSSARATVAAIAEAGGTIAVIGTLLLLGEVAREHFSSVSIPMIAVNQRPFSLWQPSDCGLCKSGIPLENPAS